MKKLILSAVAAAVIASPMAAAPAMAAPQRHETIVRHQPGRTVVVKKTVRKAPARVTYRHWAKGQRFDRRYAQNYREIDYRQYRDRRLYAPPRGYHWVRSGNDAVLVAVASGLIGAVIGGALN
ncbi:Regulator RcnB of Ni and Co efflux [Sphingomonas sp. EC-HK361]|uniref:RcnB family protein n=1 Tax=Sphingomonas sp. EC-HK361 TaxID=2038397 RepID=UPI001251301D|nr:RcnB family protein [Sphingomonas sp. EC-HK361]VVT11273.1 Regulator RcnB of Ni and Co efflux [Sphingomonas sp. EC-HK361]